MTEEQAVKAMQVVVDFMDKEGIDIDWSKYFAGKYENFREQFQDFMEKASKKTREYTNTFSDKAEDLITEAKRKVRDIADKVD